MLRISQSIIVLLGVLIGYSLVCAEEPAGSSGDLQLSEELRGLLQAEMAEIASASQALALSYVTGDWESVQRIAEQIRASYVMEKGLSDSQKHELEEKLPDHFKHLDAEFHARAEKLGQAAAAKDRELTAFHYYRMLETCANCHAAFAKSRFPGFTTETPEKHHH